MKVQQPIKPNRIQISKPAPLFPKKVEIKELKYLLVGGTIVSQGDGQVHYISANKLIDLYKLDKQECVLFDCHDGNRDRYIRGAEEERLIVLGPRQANDYEEELGRAKIKFNKETKP